MRKVNMLEEELTKQDRINEFGEVFTPPELVNEILDKLPPEVWKDPNKKWLDPTCGDGIFLREIKKRLIKYHKENHILKNMLYGVDILEDNIHKCIVNLYSVKNPDRLVVINTAKGIVEIARKFDFIGADYGVNALFLLDGKLIRNFICADGLEYDYNFGQKPEYDDTKPIEENRVIMLFHSEKGQN